MGGSVACLGGSTGTHQQGQLGDNGAALIYVEAGHQVHGLAHPQVAGFE